MAGTDVIELTRVYLTPGRPATQGSKERVTLAEMANDVGMRASLTTYGTVKKGAAVAAAAVPFADLTAAANSFNALRTSLMNAGIIA